jgi:hypothetical protein
MGHDSAQGGAMRDWYDAPTVDDALAEQADRLPRGPLGLLEPQVRLTEGLPKDAIALVKEYLAGTCGTMEFASRMEAIRLRSPSSRPPALEP